MIGLQVLYGGTLLCFLLLLVFCMCKCWSCMKSIFAYQNIFRSFDIVWEIKGEMSLVTESINMELTSLPRCDECLNVFASHFFERCLTCRRTVCCACSFKDKGCNCNPRSFETISTKCTYRLKHNCNSKFQRPQEGGSPEESVEFFLQKLINEKLHPVESNLVFLKVCNLVHENPEIYD